MPRPARPARPVGTITRGTTGTNRLRRIDRWLTGPAAAVLRAAEHPLVVDLGFGASPTTTFELAARLRRVRHDVQVVGLEIDPERVERARAAPPVPGVGFAHGGFDLAVDALAWAGPDSAGPDSASPDSASTSGQGLTGQDLAGRRPVLVRAANVLRQYPEADVAAAWGRLVAGTAPGGLVVDATCDELGRRAAWLVVAAGGGPAGGGPARSGSWPGGAGGDAVVRSLVVSLRLAGLERPGVVAERLPKALIHRNVPGEGVHAWLAALDDAWARCAPLGAFGARQRFVATCAAVRDAGWPVLDGPERWRLGEVSVAGGAVMTTVGEQG